MKKANVAEFKNALSEYLRAVESGEEIELCKRNVPFARVVPAKVLPVNRTRLGSGLGSVRVHADLTEPFMDVDDWEMMGDSSG